MKICTITCHDVYNAGASLQAYALMKYLEKLGHDVTIIDYKPAYLSGHYRLFGISNLEWKRNLLTKLTYLFLKFPGRVLSLRIKRKFDRFKEQYLTVTDRRYSSNEELKSNLPKADAYICGSDQIWNPLFRNGWDPAFYLDFAPDEAIKFSYAASFSVEALPEDHKPFVKSMIPNLQSISVREKSGVRILDELGFQKAVHVCDPVFLLSASEWEQLCEKEYGKNYLFLYSFDNGKNIHDVCLKLAKEKNLRIISMFKNDCADQVIPPLNPKTFLSLIKHASIVVSNSFHATAFSMIFHRNFYVVNREDGLNERMKDFLEYFSLSDRIVSNHSFETQDIDFQKCEQKNMDEIRKSMSYLEESLRRG